MHVMPIVYTSDVDRSEGFYRHLGFSPHRRSGSGSWREFEAAPPTMALHTAGQGRDGRIELSLVAEEPLEDIVERLHLHGITQEDTITDEEFGRSMRVRDPDGLLIQINEHDPEL